MSDPKPRRQKPTKPAGEESEPDTWTLRPTEQDKQLIKDAMRATGQKRQTLLFEVIRKHLRDVVEEKRKEREESERRLLGGGE